jgi:PKD repeat protein
LLNCSPFTLFVNTTPSASSSSVWTFSDPNSVDTFAIGYGASHTFKNSGFYKIKLKVFNATGCSDSTYKYIRVAESPVVNFSYTDSIICTKNTASKTIQFTNTSTYGGPDIVKYEWRVNGFLVSNALNTFSYTFVAASGDILPKTYIVSLTAISGTGCYSEKSDTIKFVSYPKAVIQLSKNITCGSNIIYAADIGNSVTHTRLWSWKSNTPNVPPISIINDTNAIAELHLPSNTTTQAIYYFIKLNDLSGNACSDSSIQILTSYPNVKIDFQIKDTLCSNINYTALNMSNPYNSELNTTMGFIWSLSRYNRYRDTIPNNYFTDFDGMINLTNSGIIDSTYFIKLIGTSEHGCTDSLTKKVIVHPSTVAIFSSLPSVSCAPLTVSILNNKSLNADTYNWSIDDTVYSKLKIPSDIILKYSGRKYTLKLLVTNRFGCLSDSSSTYITAYVSPVAKFSMSDSSSCNGNLLVHFYNQSSASGTILNNYYWDFGDGTTINGVINPTHQYISPGTYTVSLNVQDNRGCIPDSLTTKQIIIYGKPIADFFINNICLGDTSRPINRSILGYGSNSFTLIHWDFGDGVTSSLFNPKHLYGSEGTYTVTLIIYSNKSCVADTIIKKIIVYGKPKADFSWNISCVNTPIQLINLSKLGYGEVAFGKAVWDLGDGNGVNTLLGLNPIIKYKQPGFYTIKFLVSNATCVNLSDSISKIIRINTPRNGVIYTRLEAVYGIPLQLKAFTGGITYNWNPSNGLNATTIYNPVGLYSITDPNIIKYAITISDSSGCQIIDQQEVFIFKKPQIIGPSAFIPGGTNISNRKFLPHYIDINRLNYLTIYDRWGNIVFNTSSMLASWDGNDKNGNPLPMATYVWVAEGIDANSNKVIGKGNLTLVRY